MKYSCSRLALSLFVMLTLAFVVGCGDGQPTEQSTETFSSISSGFGHTCGLREDGAAVCWGGLHTCGLREDGAAVCWGYSRFSQASPPEGEAFASISSGGGHTCGLRKDGAAVCWGWNEYGQASPPEGEAVRGSVARETLGGRQ